METVKSQQAFDTRQHRRVIVHNKNGPAGWQDTRPTSSQGLAIANFLTRRHETFILSLCAGGLEHGALLRNVDQELESRLGSSIPSRSAFETSSARERTCIFSITWWRCAFTVRSVVPSSWAICLLILPRTIRLKTCRSRGVSESTRWRNVPSLLR